MTRPDTKRTNAELAERQFDLLLSEATSPEHGPPAGLAERTLAAVNNSSSAAPRPVAANGNRRPPLLAAAAALLGLAVVTAISFWQSYEPGTRPADALPPTAPAATPWPADSQDPAGQDPARPAAELIRELANPDAREAAHRELVRLGDQAIPAITKALRDDQAPRADLLAVIESMEAIAGPVAAQVGELIRNLPPRDPLLGPAFRVAATIAPFATRQDQQAMERIILLITFSRNGPAAGGAGGGVAVGGNRAARPYSMRDVARLLHRVRLSPSSQPDDLLAALVAESPYERELAARLLRDHATPAAIAALRHAISTDHPERVDGEWKIDDIASGSFGFNQNWNREVHLAAARSLAHMSGAGSAGARAHALLLQLGSLPEKRRAATAIGRLSIATADRAAVDGAVIAALATEDEIVLRECITAISTIGIGSSEARAALLAIASRKGSRIAPLARSTLRSLDR